jgi:hypothetical protein
MTNTINSQNIDLSSWITLYKRKCNMILLCTYPRNMCYNKQSIENRQWEIEPSGTSEVFELAQYTFSLSLSIPE